MYTPKNGEVVLSQHLGPTLMEEWQQVYRNRKRALLQHRALVTEIVMNHEDVIRQFEDETGVVAISEDNLPRLVALLPKELGQQYIKAFRDGKAAEIARQAFWDKVERLYTSNELCNLGVREHTTEGGQPQLALVRLPDEAKGPSDEEQATQSLIDLQRKLEALSSALEGLEGKASRPEDDGKTFGGRLKQRLEGDK